MAVPFADLHAQYVSLKEELDQAIAQVLKECSFIRGPHVDTFEQAFADLMGVEHCISCANGTDSLYISMKALGVSAGDEVIVPAMSWISTSETVTQAGGRVIFCDIDPVTHTMDPAHLAERIGPRTVGIIPVHLYGHPAPMTQIMEIANANGLWVIEDCAQAHLAEIDGKMIGSFGTTASYSFYPGKNLGAMGDAGGITTNDAALARKMAMYARHGGLKKHSHEIEGMNSRLDGLQAAVLNVKLPHLRGWTERRQTLAQRYTAALDNLEGLTLPREAVNATAVWHLYVVRSDKRETLLGKLNEAGIATAINYPTALPFLPCYAGHGHKDGEFENAVNLSQTGFALPMFAEMTDAQQDEVIAAVRAATAHA